MRAGTRIGLPPMACLTRLETLSLRDTRHLVRDAQCPALAQLTRLTALNLAGNWGLTDAGCQQLSALTRLCSLDLSDSAALAPPLLPALTSLYMSHCKVWLYGI